MKIALTAALLPLLLLLGLAAPQAGVPNPINAPTTSVASGYVACFNSTNPQQSADCGTITDKILGKQTGAITTSASQFMVSSDGTTVDSLIGSNINYNTLASVMHVIASSTITNAVGVGSYIENDSASATHVGVAFYGWGLDDANSAQTWGLNTVLNDKTGSTGQVLWGAELDFNVVSTGTTVNGLILTGASTAQPSTSTAIGVETLSQGSPGTVKWGYGLLTTAGCCTYGIQLGPTAASGNSINSQLFIQEFFDSSGNPQTATIQATPTSINFATSLSAAATWQFGGNIGIASGNFALLADGDSEISNSSHATLIASGASIASVSIGNATSNALVSFATQNVGLTPATWTDTHTCVAGQIAVDSTYIYVCTATNTVKRATLSTF